MIKRSKKKWKLKRPAENTLHTADHSEGVNKSKNSLTASDQPGVGKERRSRNLKKMKSPTCRTKCFWHRSKSVPSKTVTFCPYVIHRFSHAPNRIKPDTCRSNSCAGCCRFKTGSRRGVLCKKKLATERSSQHMHDPDSYMQSEDLCHAHEHVHGVCGSPGPSQCSVDYMCPDSDYRQDHCSGPGHCFNSGRCDKSPVSTYQTLGNGAPYSCYHHGNSSSLGATHVNDSGPTCSPWFSAQRSQHSSPGLRNWGSDAKYDFLMAKYSEHNCPKSHPARADYFSFQRLLNDGSRYLGNMTHNKDSSSHLESISALEPRSLSQTRTPKTSHFGSTGSSFGHMDSNYYRGVPGSLNYTSKNNARRLAQYDTYQSEAMRDLMYDSMSHKYISNAFSRASSQTANTRSDPEMNARLHTRRPPWTPFTSTDAPSGFGKHFGLNHTGGSKYDFTDDMRLISRSINTSPNAGLQSGPGSSNVKPGYIQRSRSSDASFLSGKTNYNDNDIYLQCKYGLSNGGESNKQFDNWKNAYGKFDSRKNTHGKFENWKNTYGKFDDVKPSSKYCSNVGILKSANNSNDRGSILRFTPDSMRVPNSNLFDNDWSTRKKRFVSSGRVKTLDTDSYLTKFDEPDAKGLSDKFSTWRSAATVNSEQTMEDTNDVIVKHNIRQDVRNGLHGTRLYQGSTQRHGRDFTSLSSMKRDKSLSPIRHCKMSIFIGSNLGSYLNGSEQSLDSLGTMDTTTDAFSNGSECTLSKYDTPHHVCNSSGIRSVGNINMNQSETIGKVASFHPTPRVSAHNFSWKFNSCTDKSSKADSLSDHPLKTSCYSTAGDTRNGMPYSPYGFDNSAELLNSLVDQETDRLKKLAGVMERQQDSSQNDE